MRKFFGELYSTYGENSRFEVTLTATAILKQKGEESYSIFHGLDYSTGRGANYLCSDLYHVNEMSDIEDLPRNYSVGDFEEVFYRTFDDTTVRVHSLISVVYIAKKFLSDYFRDLVFGNNHVQLF